MAPSVTILGAGAAGLFCAIAAARRGCAVTVLDHAARPAQKLLASGGGRCNFTNRDVGPEHYRSANPHFCRSALARFRPEVIVAFCAAHRIPFVEEEDGKLFCARSARDLVEAILGECRHAGVRIVNGAHIKSVAKPSRFIVETSRGDFESNAIVVATGGLSYQKLGASGLGYDLARQFGHAIVATHPALVPLTFDGWRRSPFGTLAGVSFEGSALCGKNRAAGGILFTHRGLSGPAILHASLSWTSGQAIQIDCCPGGDLRAALEALAAAHPKMELKNALALHLPKRFAASWCEAHAPSQPLERFSAAALRKIAAALHRWELMPTGTEGYETAEVTAGGVDTRELSSKTMESTRVPGLFFIGEVVDVTGELGGYNLHWAWSSAHAAGEALG